MRPILREQSNTVVTSGSTLLVDGRMNRKALIIGSPKSQTVWISFIGDAQVGVGLPLRPGAPPLELGSDEYASALQDAISAISEGTPENIGVLDFFG